MLRDKIIQEALYRKDTRHNSNSIFCEHVHLFEVEGNTDSNYKYFLRLVAGTDQVPCYILHSAFLHFWYIRKNIF